MNIWVTGANGQLATAIFRNVADSVDSNENWYFSSKQQVDITDRQQVNEFIQSHNINVIVNAAAYTAVDMAEKEPYKAFSVNDYGVRNLADASKCYSVFLIHISTDFVFDGNKPTPYTEDDTPNPINVYGKSKHLGEVYIQNILKNYLIFRVSWLYGEGNNHFVARVLHNSQCGSEIKMVTDQKSSPTYVGDFAKFLIYVLRNKYHYTHTGLYHFSNKGECSPYQWAKEIFRLIDKDVRIQKCIFNEFSMKVKRPLNSVLNTSVLQKDFSYTPPFWKESLKNYILSTE